MCGTSRCLVVVLKQLAFLDGVDITVVPFGAIPAASASPKPASPRAAGSPHSSSGAAVTALYLHVLPGFSPEFFRLNLCLKYSTSTS